MSRDKTFAMLATGVSAVALMALATPAAAQTVRVVGTPQGMAPGAVGATALAPASVTALGNNGQLVFNHNDDSEDGYAVVDTARITGTAGSRIDFLAGHTVFTQTAPSRGPDNAAGATVVNPTAVGAGFSGAVVVHDGATLELAQHFELKTTRNTAGINEVLPTGDFLVGNSLGSSFLLEEGGRLTGQGSLGPSGAGTVTFAGVVSAHGFPERGGTFNGPNGLLRIWSTSAQVVFTATSTLEVDVNMALSNRGYAVDTILTRSNTTIEDGAELRVRLAEATGPTNYILGRKLFLIDMGTNVSYGANHYTYVFDTTQGSVPSGMGANAYREIGSGPAPAVGDVMMVDGMRYIFQGGTLVLARKSLTGNFTLTADSNTRLSRYLGLELGESYSDAADLTRPGTLAPVRSGLYLEVVQTRDFADDVQSQNGRSAANALQAIGDHNTLYGLIANQPVDSALIPEMDAFFTSLSGELHVGVRGLLAQDAYGVQRSVARRLSAYPADGAHMWVEGLGGARRLDDNGEVSEIKEDSYGFLAGVDTAVTGPWRVGLAGGYRVAEAEGAGDSVGTADINQWHALAYTSGAWGGWRAQAGVGVSGVSIETERTVALTGVVNSRLVGDYDGTVAHGFGELSYVRPMGGAVIEPFVGYSFVRAATDPVNEIEAGGGDDAAALLISGEESRVSFATLGIKGRTVSTGPLSLDGLIGLRRGFGDLELEGLHLLNNREYIAVNGASLSENAAVVELGARWRLSDTVTLDAGYDGVIGDEGADHTARLGLSLRF